MAIETTIFDYNLSLFPWSDTDAPDPGRRGIRPQAVLLGVIRDGVIDQPGVGDNAHVRLNLVPLPANFMYVLTDYSCSIAGTGLAAADNWENNATLIYQDTVGGIGSSQSLEYSIGLTSIGPAQVDAAWISTWRPTLALPTFMMAGGGNLQARFTNLTNNDVAGNLNAIVRFLVYTLTQEFDAGVNTPLLIR